MTKAPKIKKAAIPKNLIFYDVKNDIILSLIENEISFKYNGSEGTVEVCKDDIEYMNFGQVLTMFPSLLEGGISW
jgi:hypothetical protein